MRAAPPSFLMKLHPHSNALLISTHTHTHIQFDAYQFRLKSLLGLWIYSTSPIGCQLRDLAHVILMC